MIRNIKQPRSVVSTVSSISVNSSSLLSEYNDVDNPDNLQISNGPETLLAGRDSEARELMNAFRRVAADNGSSEVMLVSGSSGTGKSSLIENLRCPVAAAGGYFVDAKFDQIRTNSPFAALSAALSDLCDLIAQDEEALLTVRKRIKRIVQNETIALSSIISNLARVTGDTTMPLYSGVNMSQTFQRIQISCKLFIRALATPDHPIVIFLDDVQWSDVESLMILRSLAADLESKNVLLIAAYRSSDKDDVSSSQAQKTVTEAFYFKNGANGEPVCLKQTHLMLDNLDEAAVNCMIANLLQMSESSEDIKALSRVLYTKTHGNAFFLVSLIQTLEVYGMLCFDAEASIWSWDLANIRDEIVVTDNVLTLLQQRLHRLDTEVQDLLTVAAFIGFTFRADVLSSFLAKERSGQVCTTVEVNVEDLLEKSVEEGIIEKAAPGRFRFGHDKIQQCLLDLVGKGEAHDDLRYRLGWFLQASSLLYGEEIVFSAADNLNYGNSRVQDSQRVYVAEVNLAAGVASKKKSAFRSAAEYAKHGLDILGSTLPWESQYSLVLGLTTLLAESKYCLGEFAESMGMVNEVLYNATDVLDKVPAYMVSIDTIAALGEISSALQKCIEVARELGDRFPRRPSMLKVMGQLRRTKNHMKKFSDADLLNLPQMEDKRYLAITQVHRSLQLYAIMTNAEPYVALSVLHMLDVSLKHGYSELTPSAIATYGMVFIQFKDVDTAYHYATLALRLQDTFGIKQGRCRTALMAHCCCLHHRDNVSTAVLPLRNAIFDGLSSGDIEESFFMVGLYAYMCFNSGIRLSELVNDLSDLDQQFADYNNHTLLLYKAVLTFSMSLMGLTENALILSSDVMNEDQALREAEAANDKIVVGSLQFFKLVLHYLLGDVKVAVEYANILVKVDKVGKANPQYYFCRFFYGMVYLRMARESGKRKYRSMARRRSMKVVREYQHSPNAKPLLSLLEAEYAAVLGRPVPVVENLFNVAIGSAAEQGFIQIEALANECASKASPKKSSGTTDGYMTEAINLYDSWDAMAKVESLEDERSAPS